MIPVADLRTAAEVRAMRAIVRKRLNAQWAKEERKVMPHRPANGTPIRSDLRPAADAFIAAGRMPVLLMLPKPKPSKWYLSRPDLIVRTVADCFGVRVDLFASRDQSRETVNMRNVVINLLREFGNMTMPKIGKLFCRDHTTVCHAIKTHNQRRLTVNGYAQLHDRALAQVLVALEERRLRILHPPWPRVPQQN